MRSSSEVVALPSGEMMPVTVEAFRSKEWDHEYHRMEIAIRLLWRHEITIEEAEAAIREWYEDRVWHATVGS